MPPTVVERIFQGKFQNQVKCLRCGYESNTYDPFLDVSLELPRVNSVSAAMSLFTEEERLDGENRYQCARCNGLRPALKRLTVHEAPAVLVIHLKRFNIFGGKISRPVRFDEDFTLHGHMSTNSLEPHGPSYRLYAVVVHAGGSVGSGHYYAFVRFV
jgi:ubiquitin carboxyl-terminal hydrolase 36/42